ncbi:MAG: hypothetical protein SFU27_04465, partial [Thermonemataceae bacterium]|nr:hypothetical protein [Thermonemataceae bacterium]
MIEFQDFIKGFKGLNVPAELLNLLDFQNNISKASAYAAGFELTAPKDKAGLESYSDNPDFLDAL